MKSKRCSTDPPGIDNLTLSISESIKAVQLDQKDYKHKFYIPTSAENALYRENRPQLPLNEDESTQVVTCNDLVGKINVDWSMRMMDKLWNASLYEFIRDEENCECTARYVSQLIREYSVTQCVQALEWLLKNWRPEIKARFLRSCFEDIEAEVAGTIFSYLSSEWEFDKDLTINTALIILREPPAASAEFIGAMTKKWKPAKITELVSCLDCVLDWTETYFQEFTSTLIDIVKQEQLKQKEELENENETLHELLKHLSVLYEVNLAEKNLQLAITDYQVALAEQKLRSATRMYQGNPEQTNLSNMSISNSDEEQVSDSAVLDKTEN